MLTLNAALINIAITFAVSGGLAAGVYALEGHLHDHYDKQFLLGTFLGAVKLLFIYLLVIPIILASPGPAALLNGFRLVLLGLVAILVIELFVYILTHLIQSEKELFIIGIIGGITRSEAVIAEFLDELKENSSILEETTLVILIASTTMIFRNMLIIAIVMFELFTKVFIPLLFIGALSTVIFYYTYKKTEIDDIKLKAVSLRTAFIIVFLFTIVTTVAQYLSNYPALLYIVAVFGAFAGALPIVFSVITLLTFGQIDLMVGATMVVLASAVAYMDDAFLALAFKKFELAKQLALKQVPLSIAAVLLYLYLSGQLFNIHLPTGIPPSYYIAALAAIALGGLAYYFKKRRGGGGGMGGGSSSFGGGGEEDLSGGFESEPERKEDSEPEPEPEKEEEIADEPEAQKE